MEAATISAFEEVDRQILMLARAAARCEPMPRRAAAKAATIRPLAAAPAFLRFTHDARPQRIARRARQAPRRALVAAGILAVLAVSAFAVLGWQQLFHGPAPLTGKAAVDSVVARILAAESSGALDAKAKRSSAAGPAQFIDATWLELIRAYRPDLAKSRSREQLLDLRGNARLARAIAAHFAERNAALLARRGLPVTAGTLYLAHFAGAAGAAALLSAPDDADAASVMAKADSTGKTSRDELVRANPFLDTFTVADIRRWADRKMDGPRLVLTDLRADANGK
ncbi:MAG TPA: lytic transglycosylase domain-containing protein [Pseudolabrys sp.]|nr:lytic transglycosylase domain-containing protein [Pseudolabrys sp.]